MKKWIVLAALLAASPAAAQQGYIGVGLGQASVDIDASGSDYMEDTDTTLKGFVGGKVAPGLGVEVGLVRLGVFRAHYVDFDEYLEVGAAAGYGALVGRLDTGRVSIFAKGGLAIWAANYDGQFTVSGTTYYASGNGTGTDLMFGAGVEARVLENVSLRLEFERYKDVGDGVIVSVPGVGSVTLDGSDVDVVSASAIYSF